ncbi:hypothetical protein M5D96_009042 [Drosophila gunungcola]|uniref:Uncharacterized protein n=1 Tax=Drosophila gunungcola TaxID=103775 RepID=A0A9Q0BN60_9MUSC|nr:hypothetical protein M5D96_009042 [Drosophila gunungcola]
MDHQRNGYECMYEMSLGSASNCLFKMNRKKRDSTQNKLTEMCVMDKS